MRFWDASAVVPLLAEEPATDALRALLFEQPAIVWWGTAVECSSAVARLECEGALTPAEATVCFQRLDALRLTWAEVEPVDEVRDVARRLLRLHSLRAADALQLAAAFLASEYRPSSLPFVALDTRLQLAASREGFPVVDVGAQGSAIS
ncbi:MAG: PIN domain-containing protein [Vicinamibacterales bacterium]